MLVFLLRHLSATPASLRRQGLFNKIASARPRAPRTTNRCLFVHLNSHALVRPITKAWNAIAVALFDSQPHREVGFLLLAEQLGAIKCEKRSQVKDHVSECPIPQGGTTSPPSPPKANAGHLLSRIAKHTGKGCASASEAEASLGGSDDGEMDDRLGI